MKLDYETLLSPYPFPLTKVGSVKSPTLKEIFDPMVTYKTYSSWLNLLTLTPDVYCRKIEKSLTDWYEGLNIDEQNSLNMFDLICMIPDLQKAYSVILNFFFVEEIVWVTEGKFFAAYTYDQVNNEAHNIGAIYKEIWDELCDIILQRCAIRKNSQEKPPQFKSKLAQEVWELTHQENNGGKNKDSELPNIISSITSKSNSINMINVWDLTVFQLLDQFRRQQDNEFYQISAMRVAAWGDEKNTFDFSGWHHDYT